MLFQAGCSRLAEPTIPVVMLLKAKETADRSHRASEAPSSLFSCFLFLNLHSLIEISDSATFEGKRGN